MGSVGILTRLEEPLSEVGCARIGLGACVRVCRCSREGERREGWRWVEVEVGIWGGFEIGVGVGVAGGNGEGDGSKGRFGVGVDLVLDVEDSERRAAVADERVCRAESMCVQEVLVTVFCTSAEFGLNEAAGCQIGPEFRHPHPNTEGLIGMLLRGGVNLVPRAWHGTTFLMH